MSGPAALVVPAIKRHTATVIVAHGLGDSGAGWMFLSDMWRQRNKFEEVKFIFPNAPNIPITVNGGMRMPGWYDIQDFTDIENRSEDESGILQSRSVIWGLIKAEVDKGIPAERVVIGGFSQGGALAVLSGLTYSHKLGGIFGLSCYMLLAKKFESLVPADNPNKATPLFMGHGSSDPLVRHEWAVRTTDRLKEWGYTVDFRTYRGLEHSASPQEIDDLEQYLKSRIPALGDEKKSGESL